MARKTIIGIHGLGNKPPKEILKQWWETSISEGLGFLGNKSININFEFSYWADLMYYKPLDPDIKDEDDILFVERPYVPGMPSKDDGWEPSKIKRKFLDYIEKGMDRIFLEKHRLIDIEKIEDLLFRKLFKDLYSYYYEDSPIIADKTNNEIIKSRLIELLKKYRNSKIMLIGHSMGSIIAYDVITKELPDIEIDTFITIGSPLGVPAVLKRLAVEDSGGEEKEGLKPKTPDNIKRKWLNFSDLDDKIAFNYDLADDYLANRSGIRPDDIIVRNKYEYNGVKSHHKEFGYLRTKEVSEAIYEFLTHDKAGLFNNIASVLKRFIGKDE